MLIIRLHSSEMKRPQDAMKAAYTLQGFATTFYAVFAAVTYVYLGNTVGSPSFGSLESKWAKAAYGIAIPNFLIAGSLYSHTASKLLFVRIFRRSRHLHSHTVAGWVTWSILIVIMNGAAFVLAVGVPIFNYLIGELKCRWSMEGTYKLTTARRYRGQSLCSVVHIRYCGHVLAPRCLPRRRRYLYLAKKVVPVRLGILDCACWSVYLCCGHVCYGACDCGGISEWRSG